MVLILNRPKRERRKSDRYDLLAAVLLTVKEALSSHESMQWRMAMDEELESFRKNDVFELVDVPRGATIVHTVSMGAKEKV